MAAINKICEYDGTPFVATRVTARYCSPKCRVAAGRGLTPVSEPAYSEPEIVRTANLGDKTFVADGVNPVKVIDIPPATHGSLHFAAGDKIESNVPAIPPRLRKSKAELVAQLNQRLEMKGLPQIKEKLPLQDFIRTGVREIDELMAPHDATGWGGFPRGHMTEIFGTKGAGKTSLMKQLVNFNEELTVLYFDVENGMTNVPEHIIVSKATLLENIEEQVVAAIDSDDYDLIVIDSVAMMSSQREKLNDKSAMMEKARAMGQFVRRVNAYLRDDLKENQAAAPAVIFINQLRDTGASFGVKEFTPGGRALEYGASLRLELRSAKADKIIRKGAVVGQKVRVKIEKNRWDGESVGSTVIFPLIFEEL